MGNVHKVLPRTNHINNKHHNFREHVRKKAISTHAISAKEQLANIFTKLLDHNTLL